MTDRPILFSAPMVRALLAGKKTQTRRILKPQPAPAPNGLWTVGTGDRFVLTTEAGIPDSYRIHRAIRFAVGDRLWVRETWRDDGYDLSSEATRALQDALGSPGFGISYRADDDPCAPSMWWPGIHMPREASRLTLIVTEVRVERLQDISEHDARAEGCPISAAGVPYDPPPPEVDSWQGYGRYSYCLLWNEINGKGAWEANPWVVAASFTVEHRNIDALEEAA